MASPWSMQAAQGVMGMSGELAASSQRSLILDTTSRTYAQIVAVLVLMVPVAGGAQQPPSPGEETPVLIDEGVEATIDPDEVGLDQLDGLGDQDEAELPSWVDEAHAEATNRAQALAQWTDAFFGAPIQDAERTDTFIRVIVGDDWDNKDGHDLKLQARGQVNLPRISRRLDLVFAGDAEDENLAGQDTSSRSEEAGLRLNVRDRKRSRIDATMSLSSSGLVPGVRFRYQNELTENSWYRFTQRLQYDTGDGYRSISELGLHRYISEGSMLRLKGRIRYREDKGFWDWRGSIIYRQWLSDHDKYPSALQYFIGWGGNDDPELATRNFRLGVLFRKQWLRPFLYYEIEPNYSLRKDTFEEKREWVPGIVLRLEVMLDRDLVR
jgi:hypothetical protein